MAVFFAHADRASARAFKLSASPTPQTRFEWKFYTFSSRGGVHSSSEDSASEESSDESLDESELTASPAA